MHTHSWYVYLFNLQFIVWWNKSPEYIRAVYKAIVTHKKWNFILIKPTNWKFLIIRSMYLNLLNISPMNLKLSYYETSSMCAKRFVYKDYIPRYFLYITWSQVRSPAKPLPKSNDIIHTMRCILVWHMANCRCVWCNLLHTPAHTYRLYCYI